MQKIYFRRTSVGRGIGLQLLDAVIARARELAHSLVWLSVLECNPAAFRFYARHGFTRVGSYPFETDLGPQRMSVMIRRL